MQSLNRLKLTARKARLLLAPAACLLPLIASDATAVEIDKTVSFECPFPLAGPQTIDLRIQGDLPRPDNSGALTTGPTPLNLTAELDTSFLAALGLTAGPSVIEPDGSLYFSLESNAGKLPFEVTADFEKSEPFFGSALIAIPGIVTLPSLNISGGQVDLFVDDFRLDARTYLNDGSVAPQPLGAFQSDCTPVNGSVLLYSSDSINEPDPVSLAAGGRVSLAKSGFVSEISSSIEIPTVVVN